MHVDQVIFIFFIFFGFYTWFHLRCLLRAQCFFPLTAPTPADWCYAHQTQLLSRGPGGMYPAYLPTVGEALLA